jgi:hypothetical protein
MLIGYIQEDLQYVQYSINRTELNNRSPPEIRKKRRKKGEMERENEEKKRKRKCMWENFFKTRTENFSNTLLLSRKGIKMFFFSGKKEASRKGTKILFFSGKKEASRKGTKMLFFFRKERS